MFKKSFLFFSLVIAGSLLAHEIAWLSLFFLILIGISVFAIALQRPELGIYILFGELFIGSRGRLLEYNILSLRLVVFVSVFLAWLIWELRNLLARDRVERIEKYWTRIPVMYWWLMLAILAGVVTGLVRGNLLESIFLDVNGYLYFLILPAVLIGLQNQNFRQRLLEVLGAGIVVVAIKTLLLFLWFTFGLPGVTEVYQWVIMRDIGEITGTVGRASRIFLQSQFWAVVGIFLWSSRILKQAKGTDYLVLGAAIFSVIVSLSRSFWLGGIAGTILFAGMWLFWVKGGFGKLVKLGGLILLIIALEIGGLYLLVSQSQGLSGVVASRGVNPAEEAAGGARLLLLPELLSEIREAPFFGKGFGEMVTYASFLPDRVTKENPNGEITSYAFEWGYLDMILKFGFVGFTIYLLLIAKVFQQGFETRKISNYPFLALGFLSGLTALAVMNVTTPFLNHPLGIGYLMLSFVYFQNHES